MWYLYVKQIPFDDISWSYVIKVYIKWQMEDPITLYIKIVKFIFAGIYFNDFHQQEACDGSILSGPPNDQCNPWKWAY